jgi:hypothetical protein
MPALHSPSHVIYSHSYSEPPKSARMWARRRSGQPGAQLKKRRTGCWRRQYPRPLRQPGGAGGRIMGRRPCA